ncbi:MULTISPECIES: efflux RND transporter periplasmic adaptor subunit [unclassified Sphingomonas]|jgi:multidrug efflux pump subunit AcrA (membrane-fusion protein)|uniref:efflux RND transporter periplasmic adaptor subunit n=1 Tax=unclassified Sphingomonas TaxID=196159 RepID=UPI00082F1D3C|nr:MULTISPECIES: biotin/lipoyl-binding protein [unclassified Sphingomonas]
MAKLSFSRQILPVVAIVGIIVAAILVARSQPDRGMTQPVETPAQAPAAQRGGSVAGSGVVEPSSELIEVGAFIPGVVDRVYVQAGDQVAAGQPLFSIDSRDARAAVNEAEARLERLRRSVAAARTTLNVARRQLALYSSVTDERAVSRQEVIDRQGVVEDAEARLAVALAEVREAEAQLESARVTLARLTVRAPRAAEVLQVRTREGQYATAGPAPGNSAEPLLTLGVTRPLHVRVDIDENEIDKVALERGAIISPRGNATSRIQASFVRAEPLVIPKRSLTNASTERVDIRVLQLIYALPAEGHQLFVGQQVDAFVPARRASAAK